MVGWMASRVYLGRLGNVGIGGVMKIAILIILSFVLLGAVAPGTISERANAIREAIDLPEGANPYGFPRAWLMKVRRENFNKTVPSLVKTQDVVAIQLTFTMDTHDAVITLVDPNGKRTSFWTSPGDSDVFFKVRSITSY
jgi:hypothetical protein